MTLIILLLLVALFVIPYLLLVFSTDEKALKREIKIQDGIAKLSEIQLIAVPALLIGASIFMVWYKGHTSSEKAFESYVAYSKAYCDRFCDVASRENLAKLTVDLANVSHEVAIRELHNITGVPYFGQSELFLSIVNFINTPITLAFFSLLFFVLSGYGMRYNSKVIDEVKATEKLLTYDIFKAKKFWALLILTFILTEIALYTFISSFALYLAAFLVSLYLFFITIVYKYNRECTQASEVLVGICFTAGFIVLSIYAMDLYNDYKYTIEIGQQITDYKVQHLQQLFLIQQQEWKTIVETNVKLTPEILQKYSCVSKGTLSMNECLTAFVKAEDGNYMNSFIAQFLITLVMFLIESFAIIWGARTDKIQRLTEYALTSVQKEAALFEQDIKDDGKLNRSNQPQAKIQTQPQPKPQTYNADKSTIIVDDDEEEEENPPLTIGNSI